VCRPRQVQGVGSVTIHENATLTVRYNVTFLQGDGERCLSAEQREAVKANISQDLRTLLRDVHVSLQDSNVYHCGGFGTGWARIAYLNMSELTQQCPQNWSLITSPRRTCGRTTDIATCRQCTCDSAIFSNYQGIQYSQVCGRVIGYRVGRPEGFLPSFGIDSAYGEGVSITHGSPRQHIWTLATAAVESNCPCARSSSVSSSSFVGNDYFCEVGDPPSTSSSVGDFYSNDPLWDGNGCGPTSTCCTFNDPPWFCQQLPQTTTDAIEVRLCSIQAVAVENVPIELIEIYVK